MKVLKISPQKYTVDAFKSEWCRKDTRWLRLRKHFNSLKHTHKQTETLQNLSSRSRFPAANILVCRLVDNIIDFHIYIHMVFSYPIQLVWPTCFMYVCVCMCLYVCKGVFCTCVYGRYTYQSGTHKELRKNLASSMNRDELTENGYVRSYRHNPQPRTTLIVLPNSQSNLNNARENTLFLLFLINLS